VKPFMVIALLIRNEKMAVDDQMTVAAETQHEAIRKACNLNPWTPQPEDLVIFIATSGETAAKKAREFLEAHDVGKIT